MNRVPSFTRDGSPAATRASFAPAPARWRQGTRAALAIAALLVVAGAAPARAATLQLEAESGRLSGHVSTSTWAKGYSGTGYVTGFQTDADRVTLTFEAKAGIYDVAFRYRSAHKGFQFDVNGLVLSSVFPDSHGAFAEQRAGKVELRDGANTLTIYGGWHRYEIDRVDLTPVPALPALAKPPATLSDAQATPATRELMAYLVSVYGNRTISGAIDGPDVDYIREKTGELPAIVAYDLLDVTTASIRHQGVVGGATERMIERARQGHILTYCWHWRSPTGLRDTTARGADGKEEDLRWYRGFYTKATTFDFTAALKNRNSVDYALLLTDIDMVAAELGKLAEAGVPVLWRPLHEAEGGWFWWGAKGPEAFKELWRLVYDRLTRVHHLHNLIWVYTGTANRAWYPGDDVVDVIGVDEYPADVRDPLSATWDSVQAAFGGRKLIALSEFGGVPDVAAAERLGVRWAYFASWNKDLGPQKMSDDVLARIYRDPQVITLSGLLKDRGRPVVAGPR